MCWSKGDPDSPQQPTTTPRGQMADKIKCPSGRIECGQAYKEHCSNDGLCCLQSGQPICVCPITHEGTLCQHVKFNFEESRLIMERTKVIAAFSAVIGVLVITMFVVLIALQIKYYRHRKKRILPNCHEMDVIPKPPGRGLNQPGYSWRESVRRTSKAFQKLQGTSSRSVPDDLFKMGVTIALFNLKACEQKKSDGRGEVGGGREGGGRGGGGGGTDDVFRCFSADAGGRIVDKGGEVGGEVGGGGGGGSSTVDFGPESIHSPTSTTDSGQESSSPATTEDTVGI